jgi:hypothetical protein
MARRRFSFRLSANSLTTINLEVDRPPRMAPKVTGITPLNVTLWAFVDDVMYVPPIPNGVEELKSRI